MNKHTFSFILTLLASLPATAVTYHVSPSGDDTQNGSVGAPFKTLSKALTALRGVTGESREVILADGVHTFTQAQEITAADSGTETHPLIIRALNEGQSEISAGIPLTGLTWSVHSGSIMKATIPAGLDLNSIAGDGL